MRGITAAIASALPVRPPWFSKPDTAASQWPDVAADSAAPASPDDAADASADLADLLRRHDDVVAAEQQSFNSRLSSLLNTRRELPANDRRRLNALLAELLDHRDDVVVCDRPEADHVANDIADLVAAAQSEDVPASLIVSFDQAVDGIVKSVNEDFAANRKASIVPGQLANGH